VEDNVMGLRGDRRPCHTEYSHTAVRDRMGIPVLSNIPLILYELSSCENVHLQVREVRSGNGVERAVLQWAFGRSVMYYTPIRWHFDTVLTCTPLQQPTT